MTFRPNAALLLDGYKCGHDLQYPDDTEEVYSNLTARSDNHAQVNEHYSGSVVSFGQQYLIKAWFIDYWNHNFFRLSRAEAIEPVRRRMNNYLGPNSTKISNLEALHELGFLPLVVKSLPEGSLVPLRVPLLTVRNTDPRFGWLTNRLETLISSELWKPVTSATTAYLARRQFDTYAAQTGFDPALTSFQGHDFSLRGMSGVWDGMSSGAAHLMSFVGTDNVPAIDWLEYYYSANSDVEMVGVSVPATEHSVMSMGTREAEIETFRRLITKVYPKGFVSIVSDTWDFWKVVTEYLPQLKSVIMERDGRVVIRPDSGNPVKILCGDPEALGIAERLGLIACLWEIFGGTRTYTGHCLLDSHIGVIYGDSIDLKVQREILERLEQAGFCSGNVVMGFGSFTYQYVTRDTFGMAMKATSGVVAGERRELFKDPKTDDGHKRSARGLLRVEVNPETGRYELFDQQTEEEEARGELKVIFLDGQQTRKTTAAEVRNRLHPM